MSSQVLGRTEAYVLPKSPIAMSMGDIVEGNSNREGKPYIWITGHLPFHVTDPSKLKVICVMLSNCLCRVYEVQQK